MAHTIRHISQHLSRTLLLCTMLGQVITANAETIAQNWTLEHSLQQALSSSPELKQSVAEIGARNADVKSSSLWPDPDIEFRIDNSLGLETNKGGYDLTEITVSQAIPISRLDHQQAVAEAELGAAQHQQHAQSLVIQNHVAKVYLELQRASESLTLAEQRVKFADQLHARTLKNNSATNASDIVRYLTPLEKMRLRIIREQANQAAINAEGKYNEALSEFYKVLGINAASKITLSKLESVSEAPDLQSLQQQQLQHPVLNRQQQQLQAASDAIDLARSSVMDDPTISLSRTREYFGNDEEAVYGLMFNVQIPIQDRKDSAVTRASYAASQQRIELARLQRELQINLQRSHAHLNHLVEQAGDFQKRVLSPAKQMLELSQQGFASGELGVLSLVDANDTYFDAKEHYLDLVYQSQVELADTKLYAGQPPIELSRNTNVSLLKGGK